MCESDPDLTAASASAPPSLTETLQDLRPHRKPPLRGQGGEIVSSSPPSAGSSPAHVINHRRKLQILSGKNILHASGSGFTRSKEEELKSPGGGLRTDPRPAVGLDHTVPETQQRHRDADSRSTFMCFLINTSEINIIDYFQLFIHYSAARSSSASEL